MTPVSAALATQTLSLFATLDAPARVLDGEWRIRYAHNGQGFEVAYADPALDDSAWEVVHLPHLRHSIVDQDTLWYRYHFTSEAPPAGQRLVLRFDGAFYHTRVYLNGAPLGENEGYFQPFGFDITGRLAPGDNLLAVCCHFPVEAHAFKRKTAIAGVFADWDCKPYPSTLYPELPSAYEWTVPLGLWQPARLQTVGPVLIESFNLFPTLRQPDWSAPIARAEAADVRVRLDLHNLSASPQTVQVELAVEPHNFEETVEVRQEGSPAITLQGGERRRVEVKLELSRPRLWLPWSHGQPWLYRARLTLSGPEPAQASQRFGVREIQADIAPGRWEWRLNGRRIFPKGSNYISDFYLDRVSEDGLRRDIDLAQAANLDLLRVHAHIASPDFYRLCDELGLMVMCDFPLIWTYAFNLTPEKAGAFHNNVLKQAGEMVELLGSHPSIVLWSMHNEPPWTPEASFLGNDVHQSRTNRELDRASAAHVRALDPTRPAISASGELDQHLYYGWYTGSWRDNRALQPAFPTEFGVQALPNLDSPVWANLNSRWPVEADDPSWAYAGYQSLFWGGPGVGFPSQYDSLAEYVAQSQAYQAFYIRYVIDQWRRQKFAPVGGYIHFLFTDGWSGITWSVLDYARLPKAGYQALAEASRPVRLAFDLEDNFNVERGFHLVYPEGGVLRLSLYLVNDDYRRSGPVSIRYWLERRNEGPLRKRLRRWFQRQSLSVTLPLADQGASQLRTVEIPLRRNGDYRFCAEVRQAGQVLDENWIAFRVGEEQRREKPPRRVPGWLVSKVYQTGQLRHTEDGFTFGFHNPTMPVVMQRLRELRVDGQPIDPAQIELVCGGVSRQASTVTAQAPFEIPSHQRLTFVVRQHPLAPGPHRLDITADLLGFGEIAVQLRDKLV